jgi:hypothetical protein
MLYKEWSHEIFLFRVFFRDSSFPPVTDNSFSALSFLSSGKIHKNINSFYTTGVLGVDSKLTTSAQVPLTTTANLPRVSSNLSHSVADPDPGSGAFLTPGSQDHIFKTFLTIFW